MTIYPSQMFGVGDIIFTQTLVRRLAGDNMVKWGVFPQFVDGLNRAYGTANLIHGSISFHEYTSLPIDYECKDIKYSRDAEVMENNFAYHPIRWAEVILGVPYDQCMRAKYDMYDMDFRAWKEQAMWRRDEAKEHKLFCKLGLHESDKYLLYNSTFQSDYAGNRHINFFNGEYKIIRMLPIEGYSIFDWAKVMEHATEIHSVSTATLYMFELLDLKATIHLYPRPSDPKFKHVDYLFTKPYILH